MSASAIVVGLLWLFAALEVVLGVAVLARSGSSMNEILGTNLIAFGILTIGLTAVLNELRKATQEAAEERRWALEERQARASMDLKMRSGMISQRDREATLSESGQHSAGYKGKRRPKSRSARRSSPAARYMPETTPNGKQGAGGLPHGWRLIASLGRKLITGLPVFGEQ